MSGNPRIYTYQSMNRLVKRLRDDFNSGGQDFILLYAYNGTGKTRLSMAFKDAGKRNGVDRDTLYFNAYTEDLFYWDNDLSNDTDRQLRINSESRFFSGFKELALEQKIFTYLERYADLISELTMKHGRSLSHGKMNKISKYLAVNKTCSFGVFSWQFAN
jgi:hypothetical protein